MSNNVEKNTTVSANPFDLFIGGCRKGLKIVTQNLIPNILMAYVITLMLKLLGVMDLIGAIFGPVMGIFGLPGQAITVLVTAWLSSSAGIGVAVNLLASGVLNAKQATILLPAVFLMGAQLQYMGRLLGVADTPKKYWPMLMLISIINAIIAMLIMNIFA